jgi:nitrogen-specific signal transduction histidine kinase
MIENKIDITKSIISTFEVKNRIASIFHDCVILDPLFNVVTVSQNILETTGYTGDDLQGKSISVFSSTFDLRKLIEEQLRSGYFDEQYFSIECKNGEQMPYLIKGFYMGLIADVNGLIVLKFKNLNETHRINTELTAKTKELDEFIYASAHALRGPLATLKGLIHLAGTSKEKEELDFLIKQMGVFAERLDERLHQLIYVSEADKTPQLATEDMDIKSIVKALSICVSEASIDFRVDFRCPAIDQNQVFQNGNIILSILNNLMLFFCQQPKKRDNKLVFDALSSSSATEIMIRSKGFIFNESLIEKIKNVNFRYSEILNFPELINYYAAKKIMLKLNGTVQFLLIAQDEIVVLLTVPQETQLPLF